MKKRIIIMLSILLIILIAYTSIVHQKINQKYYGESENWVAWYSNKTTVYKLDYSKLNHGTQNLRLDYRGHLSAHSGE